MDPDILVELRNRKSPLVFSEKDVEREKLGLLVEAARWAPSCFNNQSWNYVFVHKSHSSRKGLEDALSIGNGWAKKPPYIVAVGANPEDDCENNNLPYYAYNAGLSVMCLTVEAEHQGLRVHQMAGWNESKVKKALGFPESHRIVVLLALGYEGDTRRVLDKLEQRIKDRLAESRTRKPVSQNFFLGVYGNAYSRT